MEYIKKWRVNDDSLIGTVMSDGVPIAEVGPGKRTIAATDANHAKLLKESGRFNPVQAGDALHPEDEQTEPETAIPVPEVQPAAAADSAPAVATPATSKKAKE